jgi:hypothetical protein
MKNDEQMSLEKAEALLATNGPNGEGYFGTSSVGNKRPKMDQSGNNSEATTVGKEDDIEFIADLKWAKDKAEAALLFDSSSNMKIYDPSMPTTENPYFSGAAISGGTLYQPLPAKHGKKKAPGGAGKKGRNKNTGGNSHRTKKTGK